MASDPLSQTGSAEATPPSSQMGCKVVVIGASAGGVEALLEVFRELPADLPAAIFVVVHFSPRAPSFLPRILNRHGNLPAAHPVDGEEIRSGHVYCAPPDRHLLLEDGRVRVVSGPKENGLRPAIDALFRSAAYCCGPRTIGVVLTGMLDDGTAGLRAIKAHGGMAIVQDPDDAMFPGMPQSALENVHVDCVLPLSDIASALVRLTDDPAPEEGQARVEYDPDRSDVTMVRHDIHAQENGQRSRLPSVFTCPECGGVMWEVDDDEIVRYRCHVGHRYSAESMLAEQDEELEAALWTAVRSLEESASLSRRLATRLRKRGHSTSVDHFNEKADTAERRADVIRRFLAEGVGPADLKVMAQPGALGDALAGRGSEDDGYGPEAVRAEHAEQGGG